MICSFWLVSALAKAGEIDLAERLFDKLAAYANDLGLLARIFRHRERRAAGQLPAGVQPRWADYRCLGDRQGSRTGLVITTAATDRRSSPTPPSSTKSSALPHGCRCSPSSTHSWIAVACLTG